MDPSVLSLPLKTKWFGFSNGPNPATQVPQIERNPLLIIGVWHWAEPQGPRVNITWQERGKKGGKGSFDPLFIPPLSQIRLARLDNVRMIFPEESKEQCCNVTIRRWKDRDRVGREMEGCDWINESDYESIFLDTPDQCVRNCGVFPAVNRKEPTLQCYYFPFAINTRDLQVLQGGSECTGVFLCKQLKRNKGGLSACALLQETGGEKEGGGGVRSSIMSLQQAAVKRSH